MAILFARTAVACARGPAGQPARSWAIRRASLAARSLYRRRAQPSWACREFARQPASEFAAPSSSSPSREFSLFVFAISFQRRRRCCISCRRRVWSALFGAQRTSTIRRRRLVSCKRNPADATEKKQAKLPPPPLPGKRERERGRSVFCASFGSVRILAGRGAFLLLLLHSFLRSAQTCRATQKPRDGDTKLKKNAAAATFARV